MALRRMAGAPLTARGGLAAVAASAALVALVAGCSTSPSSSSAPTSGPSTSASSAVPAASASSSVSSSPAAPSASSTASATASGTATSRAAGAPACPTRSLKASAGSAQGAAGSVYQAIDFTNTSSAACTLYGYPGMALAGGSPIGQIGAAATRSTTTAAKLVTLAPGQTAYALLRVTDALNYPTSTCHPIASTYLQIYPPNQTTPIYLPYKTKACSSTSVKQLSVSVVQPGKGG